MNAEMDQGRRRYTIGDLDVTDDILHIRYQGSVSDARGHGPLEVGAPRLVAASVLTRYATTLVSGGGIPSSVLQHPDELTALQSANLKAQWVQARLSSIGEPAVLSGGVTWQPTQINPKDMALLELSQFTEARIAYLLGVPAFLVGLPAGGDPMNVLSNVSSIFDYHWRASLRPESAARHAGPQRMGFAARHDRGAGTATSTSSRARWSAPRRRRSSTGSSTGKGTRH